MDRGLNPTHLVVGAGGGGDTAMALGFAATRRSRPEREGEALGRWAVLAAGYDLAEYRAALARGYTRDGVCVRRGLSPAVLEKYLLFMVEGPVPGLPGTLRLKAHKHSELVRALTQEFACLLPAGRTGEQAAEEALTRPDFKHQTLLEEAEALSHAHDLELVVFASPSQAADQGAARVLRQLLRDCLRSYQPVQEVWLLDAGGDLVDERAGGRAGGRDVAVRRAFETLHHECARGGAPAVAFRLRHAIFGLGVDAHAAPTLVAANLFAYHERLGHTVGYFDTELAAEFYAACHMRPELQPLLRPGRALGAWAAAYEILNPDSARATSPASTERKQWLQALQPDLPGGPTEAQLWLYSELFIHRRPEYQALLARAARERAVPTAEPERTVAGGQPSGEDRLPPPPLTTAAPKDDAASALAEIAHDLATQDHTRRHMVCSLLAACYVIDFRRASPAAAP